MTEEFDSSTAGAWRRFQARLADHLAEMEKDDVLLLEMETPDDDGDGAAPYVQVHAWAAGQLRCEAVSNHYLAPSYQMDAPTEARLVELGYQPPTWCGTGGHDSANFWVDGGRDQADRMAVMAVRALRDVYGVAHPAFLTGHPLVEDRATATTTRGAAPEATEEQPAVYPSEGFDHLQRLVDEALTPWLGHPPVHDDDGDIPIDCGDVTVFVRVVPDQPVVRLFACVAHDVGDHARAAFEVAVLNRDQLFFKFLLIGDAIGVHADLMAWPFAGTHLRELVQQLCSRVGRIHDDLAARLDVDLDLDLGEVDGDEVEDDDEALHPAMLTLLQLDAAEPGSVDPRLAAAICEHDRDLVLRLLTWNEQQEIVWRSSRDEALEEEDDDLLELCSTELDQAERTTALLRAALRVVVERQAARYDRYRSRGESGGRRLPSRPSRRVPDPTLEEVDPEMWNR